MRNRCWYFCIVVLLAASVGLGCFDAVRAQGSRTVTPEGFEFSTNMPKLKYYYSKVTKGVVYKGTWIAENVDSVRPNSEIDSAEVRVNNERVIYFTLGQPDGGWPEGLYRLEIRAGGKIVHTVKFVVQ